MSEEISRSRSPKAPANDLESTIRFLKKLHGEIGRASVKPEAAARAMGYEGMTGSSLTLLASLSQYGLIGREKGNLAITKNSLRILHPTSPSQLAEAIREAALAPEVFQSLFADYNDCSEEILASHLVQNGFNPERAKRVAGVYTANKAFAKLTEGGIVPPEMDSEEDEEENSDVRQGPPPSGRNPFVPSDQKPEDFPQNLQPKLKMLAQYSIPLGANEATLSFSGTALTAEDFDALLEYVELFKKQFIRKSSPPVASSVSVPYTPPKLPHADFGGDGDKQA